MTDTKHYKTKIVAGQRRLINRSDYLSVAASKRRWVTPAFIIQAQMSPSPKDTNKSPAVGYTASKKVGNAVMRNRARRRLKEVAKLVINSHDHAGWRYVIIARQAAISSDFQKMIADMKWALQKITDGEDIKNTHTPQKSRS